MLMTLTSQQTRTRARAQGRCRLQALDRVTPWTLKLGAGKDGGRLRRQTSLRAALSPAPDVFLRDQEQPEGE